MKPSPLFLLLAFASCTAPAAPTEHASVPARPWEHERSDLPVAPAIRFGSLPNGMRFA